MQQHHQHTVLVVEDDPDLRQLLAEQLSSWGFVVRQAHALDTAVRSVLCEGPFDAVISDHDLPGGSGLAFKNWLREQVITVPFVLISGRNNLPPLKSDSRFEFLRKPFTFDQLYTVISRLLPGEMPQGCEPLFSGHAGAHA